VLLYEPQQLLNWLILDECSSRGSFVRCCLLEFSTGDASHVLSNLTQAKSIIIIFSSYICCSQISPTSLSQVLSLIAYNFTLYRHCFPVFMPVPTIADPPAAATSAKPSQKSLTKAERRELQEKQRAAKAALKQQGNTPQPSQPKPDQPPQSAKKEPQHGKQLQGAGPVAKAKPPTTPHRKSFLAETPWKGVPTDASTVVVAEDLSMRQSHGLRIFSHFGQPKPTAQAKGDIHPAIVRLGLLFSEFKICGANARCIATLTAFKQVGHITYSCRYVNDEDAIADPRLFYPFA
jgi:hypothetical protein